MEGTGMIDDREPLTPLPPESSWRKKIVASAIETDGLGGPLIAGAYVREGRNGVQRFDSMREWMQAIISNRDCVWYVHGKGSHDLSILIPQLLDCVDAGYECRPVVRGEADVIGWNLRKGKHKWEIRDSSALLDHDLHELAATFAPKHSPLPEPLPPGVEFNPDNLGHWHMLRARVIALRDILIAVDRTIYEHYRVHARISAAGTAVKALQRTLKRIYHRQRPAVEAFVRRGYFGGITYMRTMRKYQNITALDVNGMYAAAMREGVPVGMALHTYHEQPGLPGFYHVRVHCPDDVPMAFIGVATKTGVMWPRGTFDTVCTNREMVAARQYGYTFEVREGYVWNEIDHPFDDFIQLCEDLEIPNKQAPIGKLTKLLRCTVYGKFGLRPAQREYLLSEEGAEGYAPVIDPNAPVLTFVEGLWWKASEISRPEMQAHWAAWITANARLRLVDLCNRIGFHSVYYCDTDSLFVPTHIVNQAIADRRITLGTSYGTLKIEREYQWFCAIAPKAHYGRLIDGEPVVKLKGIPKSSQSFENMERMARGEDVTITYQMVRGSLAILKHRGPIVETVSRRYSHIRESPGWTLDGGEVVPVKLEE
jgi:hypothetical protein